MAINDKHIRADRSLTDIIDEVVADHQRKGKKISIQEVTKKIAWIVQTRKEELLKNEFIKF